MKFLILLVTISAMLVMVVYGGAIGTCQECSETHTGNYEHYGLPVQRSFSVDHGGAKEWLAWQEFKFTCCDIPQSVLGGASTSEVSVNCGDEDDDGGAYDQTWTISSECDGECGRCQRCYKEPCECPCWICDKYPCACIPEGN